MFIIFLNGFAGIWYPLVENGIQNFYESIAYGMEVFQCQFAFVELSVAVDSIYGLPDHKLQSRRRNVGHRPRYRLNRIRQHNYAGFPGLGFFSAVSECVFGQMSVLIFIESLFIERSYHRRSVMLADYIFYFIA